MGLSNGSCVHSSFARAGGGGSGHPAPSTGILVVMMNYTVQEGGSSVHGRMQSNLVQELDLMRDGNKPYALQAAAFVKLESYFYGEATFLFIMRLLMIFRVTSFSCMMQDRFARMVCLGARAVQVLWKLWRMDEDITK